MEGIYRFYLNVFGLRLLIPVVDLQSDESIYERECGNMPGFAVYYRFPNSQRVTYSQFIRVSSFYTSSLRLCTFNIKLLK